MIFPRKMGLKFVIENFTTFFTSRKEICHLELTLGESSPKESANRFARKLSSKFRKVDRGVGSSVARLHGRTLRGNCGVRHAALLQQYIGEKLKGRLLKGSFDKACALTCRFLRRSPPHPPPSPPPSPFPLFSRGKPPPSTRPQTPPPGTPIGTRTPLRKLPPVKTTL